MRKSEPLFSVIIPTYNRAYILWKAIQSVIAQTESRWEIIVVNDGSTDCTLRLLEEFRDERIRTITISHQGASAARNRAVEIAQSKFVALMLKNRRALYWTFQILTFEIKGLVSSMII